MKPIALAPALLCLVQAASADDGSTIQARINASGGIVMLGDGDYYLSTTLVLAPNQCLEGSPRVTLHWVGPGNSQVIATPTTGWPAYDRPCVKHLTIDEGSASGVTAIRWQNARHGTIEDISVRCNKGAGNTAFRFEAGAGGQTGSNYNTAFNSVRDIRGTGCSEGALLRGYWDYTQKNGAVVTDNSFSGALDFDNLSTQGPQLIGVDIQQWADTNIFAGRIWVSLYSDGSTCVRLGQPNPPALDPNPNAAVYNDQFFSIACDAFHGAGQTSVQVNNFTKENRIENLFSGLPVDTSNATDPSVTYRIVANGIPFANTIRILEKGVDHGAVVAAPGVPTVEGRMRQRRVRRGGQHR